MAHNGLQDDHSKAAKLAEFLSNSPCSIDGELLLNAHVQNLVEKQACSTPSTVESDALHLIRLRLSSPCSSVSPWSALLAKAPNLEGLSFHGFSDSVGWSAIAQTKSLANLKVLRMYAADPTFFAPELPTFLSFLRNLPNLTDLTLSDVRFGKASTGGHFGPIVLLQLRAVTLDLSGGNAFALLQALALPPRVVVKVRNDNSDYTVDPCTLTDAVSRIKASVVRGTLRTLSISTSGNNVRLAAGGPHPGWNWAPNLLELDLPSDADLISRACAALPLAGVRTVRIDPAVLDGRATGIVRAALACVPEAGQLVISGTGCARALALLFADDDRSIPLLPELSGLSLDETGRFSNVETLLEALPGVVHARIEAAAPIPRTRIRHAVDDEDDLPVEALATLLELIPDVEIEGPALELTSCFRHSVGLSNRR